VKIGLRPDLSRALSLTLSKLGVDKAHFVL
jgi:hypothetical protein